MRLTDSEYSHVLWLLCAGATKGKSKGLRRNYDYTSYNATTAAGSHAQR